MGTSLEKISDPVDWRSAGWNISGFTSSTPIINYISITKMKDSFSYQGLVPAFLDWERVHEILAHYDFSIPVIY